MKKIAFFLFALLNLAFCEPYVRFDTDSVFSQPNENGGRSFNLGAVFNGIDRLYPYARFYPLAFDSDNDKIIAKRDLEIFLNFFETLKNEKIIDNLDEKDKNYFNLQEARLFVMAHNFDMGGFAQKADEAYQKLLSNDKDGQIRTEFAEFLGNSTSIDRAETEFKTAISQGSDRAYYGLSIAYLMQGKREESIDSMQKYIEKFPNDDEAKKMLEIIKTAEIKKEIVEPK